MVPAAEIHPFHLGEPLTELLLKAVQRGLQVIGILLAESMEMQTVKQFQQCRVLPHSIAEFIKRNTQTASLGARVIDCMLCGLS